MNALYGLNPHYDVVIVGARCAGAATALLLAGSGAKVLVVDRQAYGSDTMSTHALMRGAVIQLKRLGLVPGVVAAGTPAIRSTTFHYGKEAIRVDIKPDHGVDCLFAPRRTVLDPLLVDAAREAGAEVHHGVALSELQFSPSGRVIGVALRMRPAHACPCARILSSVQTAGNRQSQSSSMQKRTSKALTHQPLCLATIEA